MRKYNMKKKEVILYKDRKKATQSRLKLQAKNKHQIDLVRTKTNFQSRILRFKLLMRFSNVLNKLNKL